MVLVNFKWIAGNMTYLKEPFNLPPAFQDFHVKLESVKADVVSLL